MPYSIIGYCHYFIVSISRQCFALFICTLFRSCDVDITGFLPNAHFIPIVSRRTLSILYFLSLFFFLFLYISALLSTT